MATDSLRNLIDNIPDWVKRLDELTNQIEQRQLDLAQLPENKRQSSAKSVRNVGSTESLKPKDEGAAFPEPDAHLDSAADPPSPAAHQIRKHEVQAAAQRRVRAAIAKREKTESMLSAEGGVPKYRSRTMVIVYYDSYVQSFFEELVKFVSVQRNLMRKAKMAAKIAHIQRLAELEIPDGDGDEGDELKPGDGPIAADPRTSAPKSEQDVPEELRKLRFMSTRQMGGPRGMPTTMGHLRAGRAGLSMFNNKGDIWETLDGGLEFVQGMCERAAHQFLRDGDCNDEIEKIKSRLGDTKATADKEMERVLAANPEGPSEPEPTTTKMRSYRPPTMRRDTGPSSPKSPSSRPAAAEEEDEGVHDMDLPAYKSTRRG
ncbi:hypothetical protein F4778DRAFT_213876 [Xylariomycetidae sp. FL2044]|nr:hypothetical protein F4778DRAFT_213876 [Xylariomycetidae sp. FL2044]